MMSKVGELFEDLPIPEQVPAAAVVSPARVLTPNRKQVELRPSDLESLLAEDHAARLVWGYVERQDLSALYGQIKALEGGSGRSAIAPEILLSLWLHATLEGVSSARALARLCESHDAYRWLCDGVRVNHHTLSDFRVGQGDFLDQLQTANVASLLVCRAVTMKRVAQDGMRVRAHAGAASFRRKSRLQEFHDQARQQVDALKREIADDPDATNRRQAKHDDIEQLAPATTVYAPVQHPKDKTRDPYAPRPGDSPTIAAWRERMGTDEAKTIYKVRAATAECVNALARNRGLLRFNVRGLAKVKCVALWYALAHNLMRGLALVPQLSAKPA